MLSLVIITRDEERRIADCLASVPIAAEKVVLDCGSSDGTVARAEACGARVISTDWPGYALQRNRGFDHVSGDWVLFLDADERMTPAGVDELADFLNAPEAYEAASLPRRNRFLGRPLGRFRVGDRQTRVVRRGRGRWVGSVHERLLVDGPVRSLSVPFVHESDSTIAERVRTLDRYATLWADEQRAAGRIASSWDPAFRPTLHFASCVLLKMAWADGWKGLANAGLEAWYVREKWRRLRDPCDSRS